MTMSNNHCFDQFGNELPRVETSGSMNMPKRKSWLVGTLSERTRYWIVGSAVCIVLFGVTVFFTVPMFAHTWHIITKFWGW